jgi:hypothetical protein
VQDTRKFSAVRFLATVEAEARGGDMGLCSGYLVVHADGTPFYCSEELVGASCHDYSAERHHTVRQCQTVVGYRHCSFCAVAALLDHLTPHDPVAVA